MSYWAPQTLPVLLFACFYGRLGGLNCPMKSVAIWFLWIGSKKKLPEILSKGYLNSAKLAGQEDRRRR
jgi:hypothetical protein